MLKKQWNIHPVLFAIYPPLAFYISNTSQVALSSILFSLVVILTITCIIWYALTKLPGGENRAPITISAFLFLFFSFQHILYGIKVLVVTTPIPDGIKSWLETRTGLWVITGFLILVFTLICIWVWTTRRKIASLNPYLNILAGVLIISSILFPWIGQYNTRNQNAMTAGEFDRYWSARSTQDIHPLTAPEDKMPDIYYLILDGYTNETILEELYSFDNSYFEKDLEDLWILYQSRWQQQL